VGRASNTKAGNDEPTRRRVVDAAIACILDKGFYRATSNEIARAAGVSWGVIQHYFGTRESLMVAAHRAAAERLEAVVTSADVGGRNFTESLMRYWEMLDSYYGQPEYLAQLQISWNLLRDPGVSAEAARTLADTNARVQQRILDLENQVTGDLHQLPPGYLFHALRGLSTSYAVLESTVPPETLGHPEPERRRANAKLLVAALAAQLESLSAWAHLADTGRNRRPADG
jgi:AcrR family transcriptional regulator